MSTKVGKTADQALIPADQERAGREWLPRALATGLKLYRRHPAHQRTGEDEPQTADLTGR